jgi:hypothetical protein
MGNVKLPDNSDQNKYITSDTDFVINSLNIFLTFNPVSNKALPANVHLTKCEDQSCHGIVTSYLNDSTVKDILIAKVNAFIISLKKNMLEEQLNKNINALFWMHPGFSQIAILRTGGGKVICTSGKCDENTIGYLTTNFPQYDAYGDYKWSLDNNVIKGPIILLAPYQHYLANENSYFFVRGNIVMASDYVNNDCVFGVRNTKKIENDRNNPFYGKAYADIQTQINSGCNLPSDMIWDNGRNINLGGFYLE